MTAGRQVATIPAGGLTEVTGYAAVPAALRHAGTWAQVIRADLAQAVAGFIAAGQHLAQAKQDIGHGGWEDFCRGQVGISPQTASRLMRIGDAFHDQTEHTCSVLPPSWGTLYELTLLEPADLAEAIESGAIHPELERSEAQAIVASYRARAAMPEIRHGDFRQVLAGVSGVDLVVTDPPYGDNAVNLYGDLAAWAARALNPGGSLIAYCGQATLPDVLHVMGEHLRYWWTLALEHNHGGQQLPGKRVIAEWKPVLWFVRDRREGRAYVADRIRGSRPDKAAHDWAQGSTEILYLIEQLTEPGQLVADPFAGSGSFGKAALSAGRRFIGADLPGKVDR